MPCARPPLMSAWLTHTSRTTRFALMTSRLYSSSLVICASVSASPRAKMKPSTGPPVASSETSKLSTLPSDCIRPQNWSVSLKTSRPRASRPGMFSPHVTITPASAMKDLQVHSGTSRARSTLLQVDADAQEVGAHRADRPRVDPRHRPLALEWVVVGQEARRAVPPAAPDLHTDTRVCLDVAHVRGRATVLGDEPEGVRPAHEPAADRRVPGLPALAARGLEQRHPGRQARAGEQTDGRVEEVLLEEVDDGALARSQTTSTSSLPCRRSRPRWTAAMNFERLTSSVLRISSA